MSKAKRITQNRLDNLRLEVELDNINQNANLTMAPIKQQLLKPSDMKYLVSGPEETQLGFDANVLDARMGENLIENIEDAVGYRDPIANSMSDDQVGGEIDRIDLSFRTDFRNNAKDVLEALVRQGYNQFQQFIDDASSGVQNQMRARERAVIINSSLMQNRAQIEQIFHDEVSAPVMVGRQAQQRAEIQANNERLFKEQNSRYVKRIQNTNLGAYSTQKLEGESDENYILRMQSLKASLPTPDRAVAMEKEKEKLQFRSYLSAVASPTVAETIINDAFFTGVEGERHVRLLVRAWPSFLKELKETYSKLDVSSFLEFAQSWVNKIETTKGVNTILAVESEPEVIIATDNAPSSLSTLHSNGTITVRNTNGDTLIIGVKTVAGKRIPWNFTTDRAIMHKTFQRFPEQLKFYGTTKNQFLDRFDNMVDVLGGKKRLHRGTPTSSSPSSSSSSALTTPPPSGGGSEIGTTAPTKSRPGPTGKGIYAHRKKYGHGISAKTDEPEYREFGRLIVSMPKLSDGILRVLYASNGINIAGIKSTHISEDFKDLIMTIIDTGKFNTRLFERLPNSEKPLFKKLIDVAKLKHKLGAGNLVDENEKQNLQRWELVRGEIESGNDNISLKKEAKKLISYFMKSGRLSKSEAYDLLIQLSL